MPSATITINPDRITLVPVFMTWHHDGMGEIVNLRRVKKAKARAEAAAQAADNRSRHGRTKLERDTAEAERKALGRTLDAARLDDA